MIDKNNLIVQLFCLFIYEGRRQKRNGKIQENFLNKGEWGRPGFIIYLCFLVTIFCTKNIQKCYETYGIIIKNEWKCYIWPFLDAMVPKRFSGYSRFQNLLRKVQILTFTTTRLTLTNVNNIVPDSERHIGESQDSSQAPEEHVSLVLDVEAGGDFVAH